MNLDDQIKLIKHIISLPKLDSLIELKNDSGYQLRYRYKTNLKSIVINLNIKNSHDIITAIEWQEDTNRLMYKHRGPGGIVEIDNITSIIQDYEELDINQFILTHGRDPFNWNEYNLLKIFLELLENDIEYR